MKDRTDKRHCVNKGSALIDISMGKYNLDVTMRFICVTEKFRFISPFDVNLYDV